HLSNNYEYLAESLKNLTDGNDILSPTELAVKELTEEKFQLQAQLKQKQEEIDRLKNSDSGELRETITNLQSEQAALELALAEETASKTLIENKLTTDTEILNQQKQKLNQQENTI
ncbi:5269_t:CDS:1, partial [Racocetra persica]